MHTASGAGAQIRSVASCASPSGLRMAASEPRLVWRRLDMPHPGSSITTESRKRRTFVIASGAEKENTAPLLYNGHRRLQENWEVYKLHTPIISVTKQQCFCGQRKRRQMDARITFLLLNTYIRVLSLLLCSKTVISRSCHIQ
ncbi:uncharacterized protein [Miscanthus floridulus]|uniref:uncharacterized protein n=1 Tax=Miscanthus floridulus TaxID=154761 RepID=UPI003459D24E